MSKETEDFLKSKGISYWAPEGWELSRPDRLKAAGEYLDTLFEDFAGWLMGEADWEPTTADEYNTEGRDLTWDEAVFADEPVEAESEHVHQDVAPYKIDEVTVIVPGHPHPAIFELGSGGREQLQVFLIGNSHAVRVWYSDGKISTFVYPADSQVVICEVPA